MTANAHMKFKANTLGLQDLPRLEDLFVSSFEEACEKGLPEDTGGLKRLRADLESILTEANKRAKLFALELTKLYEIVEDPPEIESVTDEVLLTAWRDKTMAEINEIEEAEKALREEAARAPPPRPPPAPSPARTNFGTKGPPRGAAGRAATRRMVPFPSNIPFMWRDTMRVRFTVNGV
mmetsp:Transcript_37272/g.74647  ORF Transcript_37272/g.74647 Transcript_37272/m.74647 type:complete len:179 (+) Transcript_37272:91-627(+)|eukprot:CAMPEP_0196717916 /NCGR_PEP_ID=MMETSP1091-20130531/1231_1 /TAXON_ID=302021 /ORGANISM="Rhodomonas sp., Strain CCMP768" /LENGTH=178 /DNA_ID=CAMNT_0042058445 /DNA_START=89 /DNA_END=625 /DNA_ORIENTATION=-